MFLSTGISTQCSLHLYLSGLENARSEAHSPIKGPVRGCEITPRAIGSAKKRYDRSIAGERLLKVFSNNLTRGNHRPLSRNYNGGPVNRPQAQIGKYTNIPKDRAQSRNPDGSSRTRTRANPLLRRSSPEKKYDRGRFEVVRSCMAPALACAFPRKLCMSAKRCFDGPSGFENGFGTTHF